MVKANTLATRSVSSSTCWNLIFEHENENEHEWKSEHFSPTIRNGWGESIRRCPIRFEQKGTKDTQKDVQCNFRESRESAFHLWSDSLKKPSKKA
jgi:hypothetical protein